MRAAVLALSLALSPAALAIDLTGDLTLELRGFPQDGLHSDQQDANASLALAPEFYREWQRARHSVVVQPFLRLDAADSERTHFDLRQAYYLYAGRSFEWRLGVDRVFWGVAESQHLIDVVNQTDQVENIDGEDRLGQPMLGLKWIHGGSFVELYLLAGFRERSFAGAKGRFRPGLPVAEDEALYESAAGDQHLDFAGRWFRSLGPLDLGIGHFHGTSRAPRLLFDGGGGSPRLVPFYEQIDQSSVDAQLVAGGWLLKWEALRRASERDTGWAEVAGFEYTMVGLGGSSRDLGLLMEYHAASESMRDLTPFDGDLFVGTRLTFNDVQSTAILAGAFVDLDDPPRELLWNLEASRRLGDRYLLSLELRSIRSSGSPASSELRELRNDDVLQLELARYF